jgi:hypothetical protein
MTLTALALDEHHRALRDLRSTSRHVAKQSVDNPKMRRSPL